MPARKSHVARPRIAVVLCTLDEKDSRSLGGLVKNDGDGRLPGFFTNGKPHGLMRGDARPYVLDA